MTDTINIDDELNRVQRKLLKLNYVISIDWSFNDNIFKYRIYNADTKEPVVMYDNFTDLKQSYLFK